MYRIAKIGSTLLALALLTACNTVEGAGEDIEDAGQGIQQSSEEVENSM